MSLKAAPAPTPTRTEGITLSYDDCADKELNEALAKIDEFTGWQDSKDIHRWNKLKGTFDREQKKARAWYHKLVKKHAEHEEATRKGKDGKPEVIRKPDGTPVMRPRHAPNESGVMDFLWKDPAAFRADYTVMQTTTFTVKVYKFLSDDFLKAGLTPRELRACAKLLHDVDPELVELTEDLDEEDLVFPTDDPEEATADGVAPA